MMYPVQITKLMRVMRSVMIVFLILIVDDMNAQGTEIKNDSLQDYDSYNRGNIKSIIKSKNNDIIIRWVHTTSGLWLDGIKAHYTVEKQEFKSIEDFHPDRYIKLADGIKAWSVDSILNVFEITQDSSLLIAGECLYGEWESIRDEPLDINGMYQRYQELENRFGMALFAADRYAIASEAMGLRFTDTNAKVSTSIIYRISMYLDDELLTQTTVVYDGFLDRKFKPEIAWTFEEEGKVVLVWNRETHQRHYTSYWIEMSEDAKNFTRLYGIPYVHAVDQAGKLEKNEISITIPVENYMPQHYRIVGIDPFGDDSEPSDAILLMGRDRTPPPPPDFAKAYMPDETHMLIEWIQDSIASDFKAYHVLYSPERDGVYSILSDTLMPDIRSFKDYFPDYFGHNYYKVCALDTALNIACTAPVYGFIQDTIPPGKPVGLNAKINENGIVTLHWQLGSELDINGYNVYFSNRHNGVYSIITSTPLRDTIYRDTINLNSLTSEVFYRISAVDVRGNTSDFSDFIKVNRPDTIPPGPALFIKYEVRDNGVYLEWTPSGSKDVIAHHLYRKLDNMDFILLKSISDPVEYYYLDSLWEGSNTYTYKILAVDKSGLFSKSVQNLRVKTPSVNNAPEIILDVASQENEILIRYQFSNTSADIRRVILLKAIGDGPFLTWKTIENPDFNPVSDLIFHNSQLHYKAMAITKTGQKTIYSAVKTITHGK